MLKIITNIIAIGGMIFTIYWAIQDDPRIAENMRTADSLRIEVNRYKHKYDSLSVVVNTLDSTIVNQEEKVRIIKDTFIVYRTPPFNNSDSAYKYLQQFIRE